MTNTFIVDCPFCRAKVGAIEESVVERSGLDDAIDEPFGERVHVGKCPRCKKILVGHSNQVHFRGFSADYDEWSDPVRVYPKPPKAFESSRVPRPVLDSLVEADRSMQASANIAACVMFGRALEGICHDMLAPKQPAFTAASSAPFENPPSTIGGDSGTIATVAKQVTPKRVMLAAGIRQLKEKNIIDARLFEWSQKLHAFRNVAAHAEDVAISREDTEDLRAFVYAIAEYIYDLADRYEEFKQREAHRAKIRRPT